MYPVFSNGFLIEAEGRLGADIELKKYEEKVIISFSLAVKVGARKGEDGTYENLTNWLNFAIWVNPKPQGEEIERMDAAMGLYKFLVRCKKAEEKGEAVKTAFKKGHLIKVRGLMSQNLKTWEDGKGEVKPSLQYTILKLYDFNKIYVPQTTTSLKEDSSLDEFDSFGDDEQDLPY